MAELRDQYRTPTAVLLTTIAMLACAGAARASAVASVTPSQAGKPATLHWSVDGTTPPINGEIPKALMVSAPAGFVLNTNAAAKRCSTVQAQLNECAKQSLIGSATLTIHVDKPSGPRDLPVPIKLYIGKKNSLLAVAFLAGVRVVPGSISGGSSGIKITFNPLPTPPVIPQVSYRFLGVTVDLGGVTRKITRKVKTGHGKHKKVRVKVVRRIHLVTTPSKCASGSWGLSSAFNLPDGTAPILSMPVACRAS